MKLFKRIKAEHAQAKPVVEVHEISFPPPATPITAKHHVPYALLDDAQLEDSTLEYLTKEIASKIDQDMVQGTSAQTAALAGAMLTEQASFGLLSKLKGLPSLLDSTYEKKSDAKSVDSFLDFDKPAKNGQIVGAWQAVVESVEKVYETGKFKVALRVTQGAEKGVVHTLYVGDTLNINYTVSMS